MLQRPDDRRQEAVLACKPPEIRFPKEADTLEFSSRSGRKTLGLYMRCAVDVLRVQWFVPSAVDWIGTLAQHCSAPAICNELSLRTGVRPQLWRLPHQHLLRRTCRRGTLGTTLGRSSTSGGGCGFRQVQVGGQLRAKRLSH